MTYLYIMLWIGLGLIAESISCVKNYTPVKCYNTTVKSYLTATTFMIIGGVGLVIVTLLPKQ